MGFQKVVQLRDVAARHFGALLVQGREGAGDVGVGEGVFGGEEFAANEGVEVVAAVPEGPFAAEVRGGGDGGGGLAVGVCGMRVLCSVSVLFLFLFFIWLFFVDWGRVGWGGGDRPGITNGMVRARFCFGGLFVLGGRG